MASARKVIMTAEVGIGAVVETGIVGAVVTSGCERKRWEVN